MATQYGGATAKSSATSAAETRNHLVFVDGFRAVAIVAIVVGHCFQLSFDSAVGEPSSADFLLNIITGNTTLFVFISGLLFHHVFYKNWNYGRFMVSKLQKVFIPYAICCLFLLAWVNLKGATPYTHTHHALGVVQNVYTDYAFSLVSGQLGLSLWYIPFVAIIFIASPLFVKFIELSPKQRAKLLVVALAIGLLVNRSPHNVDKLQNLAYFVFYYLLGIEVSLRREVITNWLSRRETFVFLALLLGIVSYIEFTWQGLLGTYGSWFHYHEPNVHYFQKIILIFFCCAFLIQFPSFNQGRMKSLADDSFGIFFTHNLVIAMLSSVLGNGVVVTGYKFLDLGLYGIIVLALSWLIVVTIKKRAGRDSRMLIGS